MRQNTKIFDYYLDMVTSECDVRLKKNLLSDVNIVGGGTESIYFFSSVGCSQLYNTV